MAQPPPQQQQQVNGRSFLLLNIFPVKEQLRIDYAFIQYQWTRHENRPTPPAPNDRRTWQLIKKYYFLAIKQMRLLQNRPLRVRRWALHEAMSIRSIHNRFTELWQTHIDLDQALIDDAEHYKWCNLSSLFHALGYLYLHIGVEQPQAQLQAQPPLPPRHNVPRVPQPRI